MKRRHQMPFGTEILPDRKVRFRLWAPAARRVDLCLENRDQAVRLPMVAEDAGWFERVTGQAEVGSRYRFRIDGGVQVPDPASRYNPEDVHGPSEVFDPQGFTWQDEGWRGRPWIDAVIYELHIGSFTPAGTFLGVEEHLDYLVELGVTAIELMPVADFPGNHNWGYDGALLFAPDASYGHPDALKHLIQAAHQKGLMVFLDVVYNHFGPEGNYLHLYAPQFFTERQHTPWGAGINFDGPSSRVVRDFFIHNALYWLEEYHLDGLRLDAVHVIMDASDPDILVELAEAVRHGPGKDRHIHLILENDNNAARYLERTDDGQPRWYNAQWNDDIHHALHVALTGEGDGYYQDYVDKPPAWYVGRSLSEGFAYQGEPSAYRDGVARGEPSRALPPTAFVAYVQTHDQVGNRAFGERIAMLAEPHALAAAVAIVLLAPAPPLLFMGEEFAAQGRFLFFCDFGPDLAATVRQGRCRGLAQFEGFSDPAVLATIPDPNDPATFQRSQLDWDNLSQPSHQAWLQLYRQLLALRHQEIIPRLRGIQGECGNFRRLGKKGLAAYWRLGDGMVLTLLANLGDTPLAGVDSPTGELLFASDERLMAALAARELPAWSVAWFLGRQGAERGT